MQSKSEEFRTLEVFNTDKINSMFINTTESRPRGYKTFSCPAQLSMIYFGLINVKMPTTVGNLTFMNRTYSILGLSEPEKCRIS